MNPIVKRVWERVNKFNKNFLLVITGDTGSGKSYSACYIGMIIDKNFSIENVAFTPKEFMGLINEGKLKKGSVIVFDEAGVGLSSREYMSYSNRLIHAVAQTFRHKNYVVIFTVPDLSFIDSGVRKLLHGFFETKYINFINDICVLRPYFLEKNQRTGDIFYKYHTTSSGNKIDELECLKPPESFINSYELKKEEYTIALNQNILKDLSSDEGIHRKGILTDIQQKFYNLNQQGFNDVEIAKKYDITKQAVSVHRRACKKKGYIWERRYGGIVKTQMEARGVTRSTTGKNQ